MKKSSLLISLTCFIIVLSSCQNHLRTNQENRTEIKSVINDSVSATDTTKSINNSSVSGEVGNDIGINKKDTANTSIDGKAIIHHAPNEDKIDSIKKAKTKVRR